MDESIADATIGAFAPIGLAKPKLSLKLLSKPPFRFLHDLVMNTSKATGFAQGLFGDEDLDPKAMDKAGKIAFLTKVQTLTGICIGKALPMKPGKVVAGLEPENTNEWLQAFARSALRAHELDFERAVDMALDGVQPGDAPAPVRGGGASSTSEEVKQQEQEESDSDEEEKSQDTGLDDAGVAQSGGGLQARIDGCNEDISTTKEVLSAIIDKPKMSEKLLGKPPFRFLHDIFTALQAKTGFAQGLHPEELMDSKAIKDKASKLEFLQLAIDVVGNHLGVTVEARPAKIVAGLEPERTNKFLQLLAVAATEGDSRTATEATKNGEKPSGAGGLLGAEAEAAEAAAAAADQRMAEAKDDDGDDGVGGAGGGFKADSGDADAGEFISQNVHEGKENDPVSQRRRTGRPTTARRRPPKQKKEVEVAVVSAPVAAPPTGIMVEGDDDDDDEDEAEEKDTGDDEELRKRFEAIDLNTASDAKSGKLVKDIEAEMDADKKENELKQGDGSDSKSSQGQIRMGKLRGNKKRELGGVSESEIAALRQAIQSLCQATNPLGKCMDHVNDDMDAMTKEMDTWKAESRRHDESLDSEGKATEESLQALQARLAEVDDQIQEQLQKITSVKANISRNDSRINQLLRMVVSV